MAVYHHALVSMCTWLWNVDTLAEFTYALWAIVKSVVGGYGPVHLVMRYGPLPRNIDLSAESHEFDLKACRIL
jgi:hypothetical protein